MRIRPPSDTSGIESAFCWLLRRHRKVPRIPFVVDDRVVLGCPYCGEILDEDD